MMTTVQIQLAEVMQALEAKEQRIFAALKKISDLLVAHHGFNSIRPCECDRCEELRAVKKALTEEDKS